MKVIVFGSRDFFDYQQVKSKLDDLLLGYEDIEIVSGHCAGVDKLGERYAEEKGYKLTIFEADWDAYGKSAGPIRNRKMARYSGRGSLAVGFRLNNSKGATDMAKAADDHGLVVKMFDYTK